MGRPAKNPEHPLTRLRKALSTPTQEMTRALFSRKVGIPEATIKAIETGKFKLSDKNAAQIASVTKVHPKCLTDPSLPITDYMGVRFEGVRKPFAAYFGDDFLDVKALVETASQVAEEKGKQAVFLFLFQRWLEETSEILGLGPSITDKLLEEYPNECFAAIPRYFWPKDRKKREEVGKRVKRFQEELSLELAKVLPEPADSKTLREQGEKLMAEILNKKDPQRVRQSTIALLERVVESVVRQDINYGELYLPLLRKKIEEAKASLQKEPKRLRTR
jgi:DNA-binding XRE family transcriptional regulator